MKWLTQAAVLVLAMSFHEHMCAASCIGESCHNVTQYQSAAGAIEDDVTMLQVQVQQHQKQGDPGCSEYMASVGCGWTLQWSCPNQVPGTIANAGQPTIHLHGTYGYDCCCLRSMYMQAMLDGEYELQNGHGQGHIFKISGDISKTLTLLKGWNVGANFTITDVTNDAFKISGGYGGGSATYVYSHWVNGSQGYRLSITWANGHMALRDGGYFSAQ